MEDTVQKNVTNFLKSFLLPSYTERLSSSNTQAKINFEVIVLTEAWLQDFHSTFGIEGYTAYYHAGKNQNEGLIVYVANCLNISEVKYEPLEDLNNYRPISVLSNLSRILEKCIKTRLNEFLDKHNVISDNQFGFREKIGTSDAINKLVNSVVTDPDKNNKVLAIFLDVKKAYDSVNHSVLLEKLEKYGIRGTGNHLIKSYLTNRKQIVKIDYTYSDEMEVYCGCPQGASISPLLFSLYINELLESQLADEVIAFADDCVLLYRGPDWSSLFEKASIGITKVKRWLDTNYLSLNATKSMYLTFSMDSRGQPPTYMEFIHCRKEYLK